MTELDLDAIPHEPPEPVSKEMVKAREAELRSALAEFQRHRSAEEPPPNGRCDVFYAVEGRGGTWEVRDSVHAVMDCIPTATAAENIANELNNAYQRGRRAMQDEIRQVLGVRA